MPKQIKPENKYSRFIQRSTTNKNKFLVQCKSCGSLHEQFLNNYYIEQDPCGCTTKIKNKRLYRTYHNMINRCYREKQDDYERYGGIGITVCDEWRNSYKAFETWALANGYQDNLTLDRIDSMLNYTPTNCRWIDTLFQNNNQKTNILFVIGYDFQASLRRICEVFGLNYKSEHHLYQQNGYELTVIRLAKLTNKVILAYDKSIDQYLPLLRCKEDVA